MIENRIMLVATSTKTSSTPSSTIPPAMPNTPERNELKMMVAPIRAKTGRDIAGKCLAQISHAVYRSIRIGRATSLSTSPPPASSCGRWGGVGGEGWVRGAGWGDETNSDSIEVPPTPGSRKRARRPSPPLRGREGDSRHEYRSPDRVERAASKVTVIL